MHNLLKCGNCLPTMVHLHHACRESSNKKLLSILMQSHMLRKDAYSLVSVADCCGVVWCNSDSMLCHSIKLGFLSAGSVFLFCFLKLMYFYLGLFQRDLYLTQWGFDSDFDGNEKSVYSQDPKTNYWRCVHTLS